MGIRTMGRNRPVWTSWLPAWAWLFAFVQWLPIVVKAVRNAMRENDFTIFYQASQALVSGQSVYANESDYFYPPLFAYLLTPLVLLPVKVAGLVWVFLKIPAYYFAASTFWPAQGSDAQSGAENQSLEKFRFRCIVFSPILAFRFLDSDFVTGNSNTYLLAGLALALFSALRGWPARAGIALAVVAAVKPSLLYMIPVLALAGRWRLSLVAAVAFPILVLLPYLPFSGQEEKSGDHFGDTVVEVFTPTEEGEGNGYLPGQSLRPLLHRWLRPIDASAHDSRVVMVNFMELSAVAAERIYWGLAGALALLGIVLARGTSLRWAFAWGLILLLMISPYSRKAHFVFLLPALSLLASIAFLRWKARASKVPLADGRGRSNWVSVVSVALSLSWILGQLSTRAVWGKVLSRTIVGFGAVGLSALALIPGMLACRRASFGDPDERTQASSQSSSFIG